MWSTNDFNILTHAQSVLKKSIWPVYFVLYFHHNSSLNQAYVLAVRPQDIKQMDDVNLKLISLNVIAPLLHNCMINFKIFLPSKCTSCFAKSQSKYLAASLFEKWKFVNKYKSVSQLRKKDSETFIQYIHMGIQYNSTMSIYQLRIQMSVQSIKSRYLY